MFVDEVDIHVTSGDGGRGCLSFHREKSAPRGGPDGGDGGAGGSIVLVATPHVNTLIAFRFNRIYKASRGAHGEGSNRTGKSGKNLKLEVPVGTVVYEQVDDEQVQFADLREAGQRVVVARGGDGGKGNQHFASPTHQAPRRAGKGYPGETRLLHLRLKLLADAGLVGFPNVGKSTLIARISAARPKIANYAFTTLSPNLGVVSMSGDRSLVVADVPGLIEGAHEGHGLGDRFLGHLERTRVLVHLVDVSSSTGRDPIEDFAIIQRELDLFRDSAVEADVAPLAAKHQIVAANKIDAIDDPDRLDRLRQHAADIGLKFFEISAVTGEGVGPLLEAVWAAYQSARAMDDDGDEEDDAPPRALPV
jgi:GTP-binding protein